MRKKNIKIIKYNLWGTFASMWLWVKLLIKIMHMDSLNQKSSMNNTYFLPKIQLHVDEP